MKTLQLSLAAAATAAIATTTLLQPLAVANAQQQDDPLQSCSCSPTSYNFRLNLNDGNCDKTAITGFDNGGVDGSLCFFTQGGDPNLNATWLLSSYQPESSVHDNPKEISSRQRRQRRQLTTRQSKFVVGHHGESNEERRWKRILRDVDLAAHIRHAETMIAQQRNRQQLQQQQQQQLQQQQQRRTQGLDTSPIIITSISFFETDTTTQLNIINQDSTYFNITSALSDGDVLTFPSISSKLDTSFELMDQMELVPGGVMLVLFGVNANNEVVRNTVAWGYNTTNCDVEPLAAGDGIGWVTLEEYVPPKAAFCGAVTDAPTASPSDGPTIAEVITTTMTTTEVLTLTTTTEVPMAVLTTTTTTSMVGKGEDGTTMTKSGKKIPVQAKSAKNTKKSKASSKASKSSKSLEAHPPPPAAVAKAFKSKGDKGKKEHDRTVILDESWNSKDTGEAVVGTLEDVRTVTAKEDVMTTSVPKQQPEVRPVHNKEYTQEIKQVLLGDGGGMPLQQQQQQSIGKSSLKADDVMTSNGGSRVYMSSSRSTVGGFCLLALSIIVMAN